MDINKHYNFSVHASPVLGSSYKSAKLVAKLDYTTALKFDNVELRHKQVRPYLPQNSLTDATKYTYYLFKYREKDLVLAHEWLVDGSVEETSGVNYHLTLNDLSVNQYNVVRDQLRVLGISFSVTTDQTGN